jgi:hypothetical protein
MARFETANALINRAAVEVGLNADNDPVASPDETYIQMQALLDSLGQELVNLYDWPILVRTLTIDTQADDSGVYDLPDDYDHMINQTAWDMNNTVPVTGPLSPQQWQYLEGTNLVSQSLYASLRQFDNKLEVYPQPAPPTIITLEYISRNWVMEQGQTVPNLDSVSTGSDFVMFDPLLVVKMLKLKYLQAKGLPAQDAAMEFDTMLQARMSKAQGAPMLNAGRSMRGYRYINGWNAPDTGYGGMH